MKRLTVLCSLIWLSLSIAELRSQEHASQAGGAQENETAMVLILAFDNSTGREELDAAVEAVPDLMAAFLVSGTHRVRVVDRKVLEKIYEEKSLTWQGILAGEAQLRTGFLSRAKYILRGSLIHRTSIHGDPRHGKIEAVELHAFLHETATTRLLKSFEARGAPGDLVNICREISSGVATFFQAELPPTEALPLDEDPRKNLLMIHGLSAFHQGRLHDAMTYFFKILQRQPDDEAAKFWLARSFLAGGLEGHAKIELQEFMERFPASDRTRQVKSLLDSINKKEALIQDEK